MAELLLLFGFDHVLWEFSADFGLRPFKLTCLIWLWPRLWLRRYILLQLTGFYVTDCYSVLLTVIPGLTTVHVDRLSAAALFRVRFLLLNISMLTTIAKLDLTTVWPNSSNDSDVNKMWAD